MRGLKRLGRPSPAMVLATLALVAALGGTAYGLARNSVGAKELGPVAVRTKTVDVTQHIVNATATQKCKKGEQVLSGGGGFVGLGGLSHDRYLASSRPERKNGTTGKAVGWTVGGADATASDSQLRVYVLCLKK